MALALAPTARHCHARLGEAPPGSGLAAAPLAPTATSSGGKGLEAERSLSHPVSEVGEVASRQDLSPRGEEKAAPWLFHLVNFYFCGRVEAHRDPWDTDINSQISGTEAARDLYELIFPLFSSVES